MSIKQGFKLVVHTTLQAYVELKNYFSILIPDASFKSLDVFLNREQSIKVTLRTS